MDTRYPWEPGGNVVSQSCTRLLVCDFLRFFFLSVQLLLLFLFVLVLCFTLQEFNEKQMFTIFWKSAGILCSDGNRTHSLLWIWPLWVRLSPLRCCCYCCCCCCCCYCCCYCYCIFTVRADLSWFSVSLLVFRTFNFRTVCKCQLDLPKTNEGLDGGGGCWHMHCPFLKCLL